MHDEPGDRDDALVATISILSRKWTPQVVRTLRVEGPLGFTGLESAVAGISSKVLTQRLETLLDAGVIERTVVSESPLRVEYALTDAGRELEPVFDSLESWGERHLAPDVPEIVVADEDRRLTELFQRWFEPTYVVHRAHDRRELLDLVGERTAVVCYDVHLPGSDRTDVPVLVRDVSEPCRLVALFTQRIDTDVVAHDCDAVVRKPVARDEIETILETQIDRYGEESARREYHELVEKRQVLEATVSAAVLADSDRYESLTQRIETLLEEYAFAETDS